ncbi:response regulator receiver protein [[Leptolyngbya] sp. PCC 7376]|uniref:response regulator n=1 Tax=[Leptolyngbya] sp. PCC 7376 TaxID=111781 RepID=UPI00029EFE7F|nr:response regulator [[Leptolyngbya] sp. PCC 7376]AFY37103.1 response regulator receiver protein [[Leptolyngbya] sp. PCC 7376]
MESQDITAKRVVIPGKALRALIMKKASGLVTIFDPADESISWHLYFTEGNLQYATSGMGHKVRLTYLLKQLFPNTKFPIPDNLNSATEYQYLNKVLGTGKLSEKQVKSVLYYLTQEAIAQVLSLPRAAITYSAKHPQLSPALLSVPLRNMLRSLQNQIRSVVRLRTVIGSPFQRLQLDSTNQVAQPDLDIENCFSIKGLNTQLAESRTLYELCEQTGQTTITLGNLVKPMVYAGEIKVSPYAVKTTAPRPLIACIDDSKATQRIVKMTLEASGLEVVGITDPAQALSTFVNKRPELILMDINMPDINGYELCRMFNQSNIMKDIPVIMLTGRDGLLDRMRARVVGSTAYIAKPFKPQDLVELVQSYTQNQEPQPKTSKPVAPQFTSPKPQFTKPMSQFTMA